MSSEGWTEVGVVITPETAKAWLEEHNKNNRPVDKSQVRFIAAEILGGRWMLNGEPIIFGKSGRLLDGQHRLSAIVLANKAAASDVRRGVDDKSFTSIGNAKRRTAGDVFHLLGHRHYALAAATAAVFFRAQDKFRIKRRSGRLSSQELAKLYESHPGLITAVDDSKKAPFAQAKTFMAPSLVAYLLFAFREAGGEHADVFMAALAKGDNLEEGSPVLAARNSLLSARAMRRHLTEFDIYVMVVKAWNDYVDGKARKLMKRPRREDGVVVDEVPDVRQVPKA